MLSFRGRSSAAGRRFAPPLMLGDMVAILEAPDEEAVTASYAQLRRLGQCVEPKTLRPRYLFPYAGELP
jgi:hypothetical protein